MVLVLINVFNETMGISNVLPAAVCDLNLTPTTKGLLTSMVFFGKFIHEEIKINSYDFLLPWFISISNKIF